MGTDIQGFMFSKAGDQWEGKVRDNGCSSASCVDTTRTPSELPVVLQVGRLQQTAFFSAYFSSALRPKQYLRLCFRCQGAEVGSPC